MVSILKISFHLSFILVLSTSYYLTDIPPITFLLLGLNRKINRSFAHKSMIKLQHRGPTSNLIKARVLFLSVVLLFLGDKIKLYFPEREFVLSVKVTETASFSQQELSANKQNTSNREANNEGLNLARKACCTNTSSMWLKTSTAQ